MKRVLIVGASGLMGRRVVQLSEKWLSDMELVLAGRRQPEAMRHEFRVMDISDAESVKKGLSGIDAVINAVGPYDYEPDVLLKTCIEQGCHYVDLAEVPAFISRIEALLTEFPSAPVSVISGCSTVPAMIEVMADQWKGDNHMHRVKAFLSMGSKNPTSVTLIYSLLAPLRDESGEYFTRLIRKQIDKGTVRIYGNYASPFEEVGVQLSDFSVPGEFWVSFDRGLYSQMLKLAAFLLPFMPSAMLQLVCQIAQWSSPLLHLFGTLQGSLIVEGCDMQGKVLHRSAIFAQENGLNIPALPSVLAVRNILNSDATEARKLIDVLTASDLFAALAEEGYRIENHLEAPDKAAV